MAHTKAGSASYRLSYSLIQFRKIPLMKTDQQILNELKNATEGLLFLSESDHPFDIVFWNGQAKLNHEFLCAQAGKPPQSPIGEQNVDDFFRNSVSEPAWKKGERLNIARSYQALVRLLKSELADIRIYRIGRTHITVFIIGKGPNGNWMGLSTKTTET